MQPQEPDSPTPYALIGGDARVREPRYRRLPFSIGNEERDQWMGCMLQAMEETEVPQELRQALQEAFQKTADWMRNR